MTEQEPLTSTELDALDAWWRAANYLSVGQIYLMGNPLLAEPLRPEHVKPRLLGHWGMPVDRGYGRGQEQAQPGQAQSPDRDAVQEYRAGGTGHVEATGAADLRS